MAEITKPNFNNALWASGGAIVAPSDVKIATGWTAEVPPYQWENYSQNRQDQGIAHILQHGIAVWDSLTEYQANKSYVTGSNGTIYQALQTNTNVDPVTDTSFVYWQHLVTGQLLAVRVITSSGTYTPTPGMKTARVRMCGGSGGSGAIQNTSASQQAAAPGSAAGSYSEGWLTAAQVGASKVATIGAAGSAGIAGGAAAGAGGTTSLGVLMVAPGGGGGGIGVATAVTTPFQITGGQAGAVATGGNILNLKGGGGGSSTYCGSAITGSGGSNPLGQGASGVGIGLVGVQGSGYGAGSSGSSNDISSATKNGVAGLAGVIIIEEFA